MSRDHVITDELVDEDDGKPVLMLLGFRYGIEDRQDNVAQRAGRYVKLTARGLSELQKANSLRT
jgi:hypothetical protein